MKIIEFRGGLGNQLFEYAHFLYLKKKYPSERFYGFYPSRELWCHQGLEVQKRFKVDLPKPSRTTNALGWLFFSCYRKPLLKKMVAWCGFVSTDKEERDAAIIQEGYWQDRKYFDENFRFEYKIESCNQKTKDLIKKILLHGHSSVSIHVRRGDYLTCDNPQDFTGICTPEYYDNAIDYINKHIINPHFYFFSDDTDFVKENFFLPNMTVVDWNKGEDSWQDMYLMSQCKAMILANSTFSFWGAQNNKNNPIVLCPTKWNNLINPQITMPGWVEIPSN